MNWALVVAVILIVAAVLIRRRYGNVAERMKTALGENWTRLIKIVLWVTALMWIVIWLTAPEGDQTDIHRIFEGITGKQPQ